VDTSHNSAITIIAPPTVLDGSAPQTEKATAKTQYNTQRKCKHKAYKVK